MTPKQFKFMRQFASLSRVDVVTDEKALLDNMRAFLNLDYTMALDVWEYLATDKEGTIAENATLAELFADKLYAMFSDKNAQRALKAVCDIAALRRAAFQYSPKAHEGDFFTVTVDFVVAGKTKECDEILKCIIKNEAMGLTFGAYLKELCERAFIEILKKNPGKRVEMSKKMTTLLLSYIAKIKTDERPLLEQRIRELS